MLHVPLHVPARDLMLGCVEHFNSRRASLSLSHEHGCYHVRGFRRSDNGLLSSCGALHVNESFRTIREARRFATRVCKSGHAN